ncbi:MAG: hypothetical protein MJA27_06590 [Pseudanabaenales cyanobacterium]|nr:hypothetical protein [Pseudanabaenales cyanobacterium]
MREIESCWKSFSWFDILSLPALSWTRPFLPHCNLPLALIANLPSWDSIQHQAREAFIAQTRQINRQQEDSADLETQARRRIVGHAFHQLAQVVGAPVARDYEHWVRIHFFSPEFELAIDTWRCALSRAYPYQRADSVRARTWRERQVSPPEALVALLPTLEPFVNLDTTRKLQEEIFVAAPKEKVPEWSLEYTRKAQSESDRQILENPSPDVRAFAEEHIRNRPPIPEIKPCHEAHLLAQAIEQTVRFKALQTLAQSLNASARNEVVDWAQRQLLKASSSRGHIEVERLRRDKYLQTTLPDFEGTSVFDLPLEQS